MKYFACIFALIAVIGMASAGYIHSGLSRPYAYSYSRPVVYSSGYHGHGGYGGYGGHGGYGSHGGYGGYGGYRGYGGYGSYGHGGYSGYSSGYGSGWW